MRLASARRAGVRWLEPAPWRRGPGRGPGPVAEGARPSRPQVSWLCGLKGTDGRVACRSGVVRQVTPVAWREPGSATLHRGGQQRSAAGFRSAPSHAARGLCSANPKETPDGPSPAGGERSEAGAVPGHGLFKFKELVSPEPSACHLPEHLLQGARVNTQQTLRQLLAAGRGRGSRSRVAVAGPR